MTHDPAAAAGRVLVVRTLDPALAGVLPTVAGLVAETGSPLSHLAILAREYQVPAVVGLAGTRPNCSPTATGCSSTARRAPSTCSTGSQVRLDVDV